MPDAGWYTILMGELRTGRTRTTTSPHQKTHATRASPRASRCLVVRRPNELVEHPKRWASPLPSRRRSRRNIRLIENPPRRCGLLVASRDLDGLAREPSAGLGLAY